MCKAIFLLKELDLEGMVESFSLLKVPKMPELKSREVKLELLEEVEVANIPYSDKVREKARLRRVELAPKRLELGPKHVRKPGGKLVKIGGKVVVKTDSWTVQKDKKVMKEKRKSKKEAKKQYVVAQIKASDT